MPTEYLRILYLLIIKTEFEENADISITNIPRKTKEYMGHILTWVLWKYSYTIKSAYLFHSLNRIHNFCKIHENTFISVNELEDMYEINARINKIWRSFNILARQWRLRRAKIYNTEDLYMNTIYPGDKNTIILLKNNVKYVFALKDLIGNFNRELSNTCNLFIEPLPCKNPYTNECFTKSDLYNIYFAVRESTFIMPRLLHEYFLADFCLSRYTNENEHMIRDFYIDKYINRITNDILLESVQDMFSKHKLHNLKIHRDFPKMVLKDLMTPYLKLYFINKLTLNKWKKADSFMKLHAMLHILNNESPSFGRKKYMKTMVQNKPKYLKHYFETKVPKINTISLDKFMENHLHLNITEDSNMMFNYEIIQQERRQHILMREMPSRYQDDELNQTLHNMRDVNEDEDENHYNDEYIYEHIHYDREEGEQNAQQNTEEESDEESENESEDESEDESEEESEQESEEDE